LVHSPSKRRPREKIQGRDPEGRIPGEEPRSPGEEGSEKKENPEKKRTQRKKDSR